MYTSAIIPAAGFGKRMGGGVNKQFLSLHGRPIIICTLEQFQLCDAVDEIIISTQREYFSQIEILTKDFHITKVSHIVEGGRRRQDSVANALPSLNPAADIVIVHDAVRPFISRRLIVESIECAKEHQAAVVAVPVKDTIKLSESGIVSLTEKKVVVRTLDRSSLWITQTPQAFQKGLLIRAYDTARQEGIEATDDASLVERLGVHPEIIEGAYENIKITTPDDLDVAEIIAKRFKNS